MPIWVPILVLAAALVLTVAVSVDDYLDLGPIVPAGLGTVIALGAVGALTLRWDLPWTEPTQPRPSAWLAWLFLLTPIVGVVGAVGWHLRRASHVTPLDPVGTCRRCGAPLFADRTGRRYLADCTGYLCPPPFQEPGNRRHHLHTSTGGHR